MVGGAPPNPWAAILTGNFGVRAHEKTKGNKVSWEQNQYIVVEKVKNNENGFDIIGIWMINACYSSRLCIAKSWNSSIFDPKTTQDIKTQNIAEPLILDFVALLNSSDTFQLLRVHAMNIIALTASRPGSHKTTQISHLEGDCWEGHQLFQGFHVFLPRYAAMPCQSCQCSELQHLGRAGAPVGFRCL